MSDLLVRNLKGARFSIRSTSRTRQNQTWIPPDQSIEVAGRAIQGMVYISKIKNHNSIDEGFSNSVINIGLSIDKKSPYPPQQALEYHHYIRYERMLPSQRATYLDWLAGSRAETHYNEAYIRLYFYGLEHRFFLDPPSDEEGWIIIHEVERLIKVYTGVNGFSHAVREMTKFLEAAYGLIQPPEKIQPRFVPGDRLLPFDVSVGLAYQMERHKSLSADWVLSWYASHPRTNNLQMVAKRALPEFRVLFDQMFVGPIEWKYYVQPHAFDVSLFYQSGSSEFFGTVETPFDDMNGIEFDYYMDDLIESIVDDATSEMRRYSQFIGKDSMGRNSFEAYLLLPITIQSDFPIPAFEPLKKWCLNIIEKHGGQTTVDEILAQVFRVPSTRKNWRQLRDAEHVLSRISIGMVPFFYYELRTPQLGEPVFLTKMTMKVGDRIMDSEEYLLGMISVKIGAFIALSDGPFSEQEKEVLDVLIRSEITNQAEKKRIQIYLKWLERVPPTLPECRKLIKDVDEILHPRLRITALCMASIDGGTNPVKMKALKSLYRALQLPTDSIYSDLHDVATSGSIETIMSSLKVSEFPSSQNEQDVSIDQDQVASLMKETSQVSEILGQIFDEQDTQEGQDSKSTLDGLDAECSAFLYKLIERPIWSESDFHELAKQFQVMQQGVIETLNEWSYEQFGDALIDGDHDYELNSEIIQQLRTSNLENPPDRARRGA